MRRVSITLCFILAVCISFAQTKADHLTFKGVPLDGALGEYVSKMKKAGFVLLKTGEGIAMLKGDFAGHKDCRVGVSTLKQKDLVHKIGVVFPDRDTWSGLAGDYYALKEMLTEKYGKPSLVLEDFNTRNPPRDASSRMFEVQFDRCVFHSIWDTENGEIELSIDHDGVTSCFVKLLYIDKVNSAKVKKHAIDDL